MVYCCNCCEFQHRYRWSDLSISPTTFLHLLASRAALFRNDPRQLFSPEVPRGSAPSGVQRT
jgi:hypothetical protein